MHHSLRCAFLVFKGPWKERKCQCPDVFVYTMGISWAKCSWLLPLSLLTGTFLSAVVSFAIFHHLVFFYLVFGRESSL